MSGTDEQAGAAEDPEIAALAALPGVREAAVKGSARRVFDAILVATGAPPTVEQRAAVERWLRTRRAHLTPIQSAPSMFTLNGCGTRLLGAADVDLRDGTQISTLFLTLVFLPVLPLSSWLVRPAGGRRWQFLARAPLSTVHRSWKRIGLSLAVLVPVALGLVSWRAGGRSTVHLLNGLDVAATVAVDGEAHVVAAHGGEAVELAAGTHRVVTTTAGNGTVETLDVLVPRRTDVVVYNVLGAAPWAIEDVEYLAGPASPGGDAHVEILSGPSFLARDRVEYVFVAPPSTLDMKGTRETRRHAVLAEGGWKATAAALFAHGQGALAQVVTARVALALKDDDAIAFAGQCAAQVGPEAAERFAAEIVDAAPGSVEAHRFFQSAWERAGRKAELVPRYREAYERSRTAQAGYLYARLLPPQQATTVLADLLAAHPEDARLQRLAAWACVGETRWADALPHFERLAALDAKLSEEVVVLRATALVGAGRVPDAQRVLLAAIRPGSPEVAVAYGRVHRLPGADPSFPTVMEVAARLGATGADLGDQRAQLAALVPDPAEFEKRRTAIRDAAIASTAELELVLRTDPDRALATYAAGSPEAVVGLAPAAAILLIADLLRAGDDAKAHSAYGANLGLRWVIPFERLADPGAATSDDALTLDPAERAALAFAASRRAKDPAERQRWLVEARRFDPFRALPLR